MMISAFLRRTPILPSLLCSRNPRFTIVFSKYDAHVESEIKNKGLSEAKVDKICEATEKIVGRPDRIVPITQRVAMDAGASLDNIVYARAYTCKHQYNLLLGLLSRLTKIADEFNVAGYMTNQVRKYNSLTTRNRNRVLEKREIHSFHSGVESDSLALSMLDRSVDGFLLPKEIMACIEGQISEVYHLRNVVPESFLQTYLHIASRRFLFFCGARGRLCMEKVLRSNTLQEFIVFKKRKDTDDANWFSFTNAYRVFSMYTNLSVDGKMTAIDLRKYGNGILTHLFIDRVFHAHVRGREMSLDQFLDLVLAQENRDSPEGLTYLFHCFDTTGRGYLATSDFLLFGVVYARLIEGGNCNIDIEDVRSSIWELVNPVLQSRITLPDLLACKDGGKVASMLMDVSFWADEEH